MLHSGQCLRTGQADIAHMADVKNANPGAHSHMLGDDTASDRGRVFDGHIPTVELDHLGAHLAMDGVQGGFSNILWDDGRRGFYDGKKEPRLDFGEERFGPWLGCSNLELIKLTPQREWRQLAFESCVRV